MKSFRTLSGTLFLLIALIALPALLSSCGGGGGEVAYFPPAGGGTRYSISGTVTDGISGMAGVTVNISGAGAGEVATDANGGFTIPNLQPGTYTLAPFVSGREFLPGLRTVTLSSNTSNIDFALFAKPDASETASGSGTDNAAATASPVTISVDEVRSLYPDGDVDWVKITFPPAPTDKIYEFSANNLSNAADTVMALYSSSNLNNPLVDLKSDLLADDYIGLDSRIKYTIPLSPTAVDYYVRVETTSPFLMLQDNNGIATYTLNVHEFVDTDSDGYSNYYDCDDNNGSIHPGATDDPTTIADEDCTAGINQLDGTTADSAEPDNIIADANPMSAASGDGWEAKFHSNIYSGNARTISPANDVDVFSIAILPRSAVYVQVAESFTNTFATEIPATTTHIKASQILQPSGNTVKSAILNSADPSTLLMVENADYNYSTIVYIKFEGDGAHTGYYVPFYYNIGTDLDGDGYYTEDWPGYRDCNDGNANTHPGAADISVDGIDQNCNGLDGS